MRIAEPNIIEYLPPFMQEHKEIKEIMRSENPEFQLVVNESETIRNNQFIVSCDLRGIKRFEKLLGIVASPQEPLQARVTRALVRWNDSVPYTLRNLKAKLDDILGANGYILTLESDKYHLVIDILEAKVQDIKLTAESVGYMCPMNLLVTICGVYKNIIPNPNTLDFTVINVHLYNRYYSSDIQLDGKRKLDGTWKLNSETPHRADLHSLAIKSSLPNLYGAIQSIAVAVSGAPPPYNQDVAISSKTSIVNQNLCDANRVHTTTAVINENTLSGTLITDTVWKLDGSIRLDGSRKLNAGIKTESI